MADIISKIDYDEKDPKFQQIRDEFTSEIKKRFSCENYDDITKYVFEGVLKSKNSKQDCIKDFSEIFNDKTEELMDFLWKLSDKVLKEYENNKEGGDVLHSILEEDKNGNKVKAQSKVESKEKNDIGNNQNYRYNKRRERQKNTKEYHNNIRDKERYHNQRDNRRGHRSNRLKIGDKEVIIHSNLAERRSRSRSRNQSDEKRGVKDEKDYQNKYPVRGYYPQNLRGRFQQMRGMLNSYYFQMMNFVNPRRPFFRFFSKNNNTQKGKSDEEKNQEFQNQAEPKSEEKPQNEEGKDQEKIQESEIREHHTQKKMRCKNWPHCTNKNCEYTHPTETCKHFPNCAFGDKCSYIHPNIPCKFGYYCTRLNCAYSHPPGCNPGMAMYPNMMQPIPIYKHKGKKLQKIQQEGENSKEGQEEERPEEPANQSEKSENPGN